MQQQAVVLCAYLASRGQQPTEIPSAPKDPLVEVILKRYAGVYQPALCGKCGCKDHLELSCMPEGT